MGFKQDVPPSEGLGRFDGVSLLKPGVKHILHAPQGQKGNTVFRIFPEFERTPEGFREVPMRREANDYTQWIRGEKMVRQFGVLSKITCNLRTSFLEPLKTVNPIETFRTIIQTNVKKDPHSFPKAWFEWVNEGKMSPLTRVETLGVVQCGLFENGGRKFLDAQGRPCPIHPVVLVIPKSAVDVVQEIVDRVDDKYTGPENDLDKRFMNSGLITSANGQLITLVFKPQQGKQLAGYEVQIGPKVPWPAAQMASEWTAWEQLMNYHSVKAQVEMLCECWPPDAVDYALSQGRWASLMPDSVKGAWAKRFNHQTAPQQALQVPQYQAPASSPPQVHHAPTQFVAPPAAQTLNLATAVTMVTPEAMQSPAGQAGLLDNILGGESSGINFGGPAAVVEGPTGATSVAANVPFDGGRPMAQTPDEKAANIAAAHARLKQAQALVAAAKPTEVAASK